jgi:heme-degrading monooxygenase HmoA
MVLEQFVVRIHPGQQVAFEAAMERGLRTVMARAPGLQGWTFRRCVEVPERYQVQIRWETIEAHTVGYRQGPLGPEFRAMVMPFFAEAPEMQHFEDLARS